MHHGETAKTTYIGIFAAETRAEITRDKDIARKEVYGIASCDALLREDRVRGDR